MAIPRRESYHRDAPRGQARYTQSTMGVLRRLTIAAGFAALVLYGAAVAYMMSQETRLVFRPRADLGSLRPAPPFEQADMTNHPGVQPASMRPVNGHPFAWIMRAGPDTDARPWIIFFHGNDATVGSRLNIEHYEHLRQLGFNVFAPEYPGFAGVDGVPTEPALEHDGRLAYDFVRSDLHVPPRRIILYGWSLGSAVAVDLASHVDEAALILEGALPSVAALGAERYPWLPVRLVIRNPFESILKIPGIRAPVLFLHSPDDQIVPIADGRRLFDAAPAPKQFVEVEGGHIYASERDPRFFPTIKAFLAQYGLTTGS